MEEDLSKELDLQIKGAEKPSIWELFGVRFILLPYTIGKVRALVSIQQNFRHKSFQDCLLSISVAILEFDLSLCNTRIIDQFSIHPAIVVEWFLVLEISG